MLEIEERHVVLDNGIVRVTLSKPGGIVTGIKYNNIDNLLQIHKEKAGGGYWDLYWNEPNGTGIFDLIKGTHFSVVFRNESQIEVSFTRTWKSSMMGNLVPLNIDKRFILLSGRSGFYSYAIFEHLKGWPDLDVAEIRMAFKLREDKFHYMAIADHRGRIMPMPEDRLPGRGQQLAYPEAVLLVNPINPNLAGEVDDKYQYSCDNKDNRVHGWISDDPPTGFWCITPSNEFRTGGPVKQDLTSHVGPTSLAMFVSTHYAGDDIVLKLRDGEPWKKVFGPVYIYMNSKRVASDSLWQDAKFQMMLEEQSWPYEFPASVDFPTSDERGSISGRLMVKDRYISQEALSANSAYLGLAPPGEAGSWQRESKGYQFWCKADPFGFFTITHVRVGSYNLYAWIPGVIGDYKYELIVNISSGTHIDLGDLVYEPPRDGPTMWEIGIPDRSAAEFYIPHPKPHYVNKLFVNNHDKFRQYGLWERYTELFPIEDLIYRIGSDNYTRDWFFAQVTRSKNGTYHATTWQIKFNLDVVHQSRTYKLRIALASATKSDLQVRFNDPKVDPPHFSTGRIGTDNTIARHGIHGLYWLFNVDIANSWLLEGENTIFLTQAISSWAFEGILYDYIRLEGPSKMAF
ncbi:unnamed protein product [Victoria cruziana]